ncbi:MAG: hypothetical protein G8237_10510 [Magnetococcales bacterium]|nr:MucR family transcriptional regulator [Magnetococcales bacterium]NGZ06776.1 hypothetical protein [Magnetococcales bacterium]
MQGLGWLGLVAVIGYIGLRMVLDRRKAEAAVQSTGGAMTTPVPVAVPTQSVTEVFEVRCSTQETPVSAAEVDVPAQPVTSGVPLEVESTPEPVPEPIPLPTPAPETGITCLVCGQTFKGIKVHLGRTHKMTVEQYREQFGLDAATPLSPPAIRAVTVGKKGGKPETTMPSG